MLPLLLPEWLAVLAALGFPLEAQGTPTPTQGAALDFFGAYSAITKVDVAQIRATERLTGSLTIIPGALGPATSRNGAARLTGSLSFLVTLHLAGTVRAVPARLPAGDLSVNVYAAEIRAPVARLSGRLSTLKRLAGQIDGTSGRLKGQLSSFSLVGTLLNSGARLTGNLSPHVPMQGTAASTMARLRGNLTFVYYGGFTIALPRLLGNLGFKGIAHAAGQIDGTPGRLTGALVTTVALKGRAPATPARLVGAALPSSLALRGLIRLIGGRAKGRLAVGTSLEGVIYGPTAVLQGLALGALANDLLVGDLRVVITLDLAVLLNPEDV